MTRSTVPIPVVLDTDIGGDIDDTWALAMLLRCPELEPRLVLTAIGDTTYRARVAAGILAAAGREEVPIGIGPATELPLGLPEVTVQPQQALADATDLSSYAGSVRTDGIEALVECIMESPEPVTVIAIAPLTNIAAALALEPRITQNARLVAMLGSIRKGLFGAPEPAPEWNVMADVPACRAALAADWEVTITPLDSCGRVYLDGERYAAIQRATDPLLEAVMRTYREWAEAVGKAEAAEFVGIEPQIYGPQMYTSNSSVLFDTVAVYLAYEESLLEIEPLPIAIEADGMMRVSAGAPVVRVAMGLRAEGFLDHLTRQLTVGHGET
ncbi:MAG TPA: nucleoside hydrolase [Solirubrobacterales bacterium]|nr:nucleoside hydrolase [Solirubrobacterales bacterium]